MSNLFIDSGWEYGGADELNIGVGLSKFFSVAGSKGILHLQSDFKESVEFDYAAAGGGASVPLPSPIDFDITTKDAPSVGKVYTNSVFRESLSLDDFTGPCLIYTGTGVSMFGGGGSASIMFFAVGKGIVAGWMAFVASGGLAAPFVASAVIGSCSALVVSAGVVAGSPQAGATGLLGYVSLRKGRRGSADLCGVPWKVTTNGEDYSYVFHEEGSCYWYEYSNVQVFPNCQGKWRVVGNKLEINWESGDKDTWNLPISLFGQTGTWKSKNNQSFNISAKKDWGKVLLTHKTVKTSSWSPF